MSSNLSVVTVAVAVCVRPHQSTRKVSIAGKRDDPVVVAPVVENGASGPVQLE